MGNFVAGLVCLLSFFTAVPVIAAAGTGESAWQRPGNQGGVAAGERKYFYNYPHQVPPDYVYRTGRIWAPLSFIPGASRPGTVRDEKKSLPGGMSRGGELALAVKGMAAQLVSGGRDYLVDDYVVAVASFVNLGDLYQTSSLGRYLGEELMGDLARAGVGVVEIRKTPGLFLRRQGGEYGLSRDLDALNPVQDAQAVVVGTYTYDKSQILVNARLLRNGDSMVISTASLILDMDELTRSLLADENQSVSRRQKHGGVVRVRQAAAE